MLARGFYPGIFLSLLFLASCSFAQEQEVKTPALRILCYNIHHGEGMDRKIDLRRISETISAVKPDVVCLQEVDVETSRSKGVDQAKEIASLTKMNFVFGANLTFGGGKYGNAILSKFDIEGSQNIKLPNHREGEQRGVLKAKLKTEAGLIHIWCTHFDHRKNDSERVASAEWLVKNHPEDKEVFLAGDFNDVIGSKTLKVIERKWSSSSQVPLATVPVTKPKRQIDFVFSSKGSRWECVSSKVLAEPVASDHRAILAVYQLKRK